MHVAIRILKVCTTQAAIQLHQDIHPPLLEKQQIQQIVNKKFKYRDSAKKILCNCPKSEENKLKSRKWKEINKFYKV